jgi:hypothetical protein
MSWPAPKSRKSWRIKWLIKQVPFWKIYSSPAMEIDHGNKKDSEKPADYRPATLPLMEPLPKRRAHTGLKCS